MSILALVVWSFILQFWFVKYCSTYLLTGDTIFEKMRVPKILKWLGFTVRYHSQVISKPIVECDVLKNNVNLEWVYDVKILSISSYYLGIKLKTIDL